MQTSAGPGPSQGDTSCKGDTSDEDASVDENKTAARPAHSREYVVQSCRDILNNRPPNSVAIATVATDGDDSSEAEQDSGGDNGSEGADDDSADDDSADDDSADDDSADDDSADDDDASVESVD